MAVSDHLPGYHRHRLPPATSARPAVASTTTDRGSWFVRVLHHGPRWLWWTLLALIALLVAARIAAPFVITHQLNRILSSSPEYQGHVQGVSLHLYRGAYQLHGLVIRRSDAPDLKPLLSCPIIDLAISWRGLFHGAVVGRVVIDQMAICYAQGNGQRQMPTPTAPLAGKPGETPAWQQKIEHLLPFSIDEVRVVNGTILYQDPGEHLDLGLGKVQLVVTNLTNRANVSRAGNRLAAYKAEGELLGGGHLDLSGDLDPYAGKPTFHLQVALRHLDLIALNPLLEAYEHMSVKHGALDLFIDATVTQGRVSGYLKPLLSNFSIYSPKDLGKSGVSALREAVVGAADRIFKNHPKDSFATQVPLEGDLSEPGTSVLTAIVGVLKNGFIRALLPQFEQQAPTSRDRTAPQDGEADRALQQTKKQARKSKH